MDRLDLETIFNALPGRFVILRPSLDVVAVSELYLAATMTTREALVGRNLLDVFPENPEARSADGSGNVRASIERVLETGQPHVLEAQQYDLRGPDGTCDERYWRLSSIPVLADSGAITLIIHQIEDVLDITDRVRAEKERQALAGQIARQARIFEATLSSITDFAYVFDKDGRFAYVNQALLNLWGLTLDEAVGKNFVDLKYPSDLAEHLHRQVQQVFETGEIIRDETSYTSPSGVPGYYEYIFTPVRSDAGDIEGVAGSTRDITKRKAEADERERLLRAHQALQTRNTELLEAERAARAEAERVGYVKDEFLATLSHELRTPLNAILGWAQLLTRRDLGRDQQPIAEGLAVIERNAHIQKQLIEDLLDMSRIVSGKVRLDLTRLQLGDIVSAARTTLQPTADARGVRIATVIDTATPHFWGDESRLQQIVWNLLSNAIKFTPLGGTVDVLLRPVRSELWLTVADTGAGIAAEFLPHVFERFRQSDASTTRVHSGLGLGLAIVKTLVELHGGRVEARSDGLGAGATFTVRLPHTAARAEASMNNQHVEADAVRAVHCSPRLLRGVKVLVVDDEPDGRTIVGRILEECSAQVALAGSTEGALKLLTSFAPDVLVSDIGMPETDGYELIRQVRALDGAAATTPAVALTALARPDDRSHALLAGFQAHIKKPVDAAELVEAVALLVARTAPP